MKGSVRNWRCWGLNLRKWGLVLIVWFGDRLGLVEYHGEGLLYVRGWSETDLRIRLYGCWVLEHVTYTMSPWSLFGKGIISWAEAKHFSSREEV